MNMYDIFLLIDQGNTTTKYFVITDNNEVFYKTTSKDVDKGIVLVLVQEYKVKSILVSTVRQDYDQIKKLLGTTNILYFDDDLKLPLENLYTTPETLGKDRIAAACGAMYMFPNTACLVVDAGTCITYDFIDAAKKYYGGSISPGIEMRLKAMHTFTGKLPQANIEWVDDFVGNSTETSLQTGALQGAVNEIDGFVRLYKQRFGEIQVIMCGGNTDFLANRCESEIFAAPNLVIIGLNTILKHNLPHGA